MSKVALNVDILGKGTLTVDGQDMSGIVREARIISSAGEATRVELEMIAVDADAFAEANVAYRVYFAGHWGEGSTPRKAVENVLDKMPKD